MILSVVLAGVFFVSFSTAEAQIRFLIRLRGQEVLAAYCKC